MTKKEERNNKLLEIMLNIFREHLWELNIDEDWIVNMITMNTTQDIYNKIEESFIDKLKNEKWFLNFITWHKFFKNNKSSRKNICDMFMFNYWPRVIDEWIN